MFDRFILMINRINGYAQRNKAIIEYYHIETSNEYNFLCILCPLTIERAKKTAQPETLLELLLSTGVTKRSY
jgi:hypothetical protein